MKPSKGKVINPQILLEMICCALFGAVILYLTVSGKYLSYVTPRMKPYLYFAVFVMLLWICAGTVRLFRPRHKMRTVHCLVLAIPVLMLVIPHEALNGSDFSSNYNGRGAIGNQTNSASSGSESASGNQQTDRSAPSSAEQPEDPAKQDKGLTGLDKANKRITVSNDEFYRWIRELFTNLDQYTGYTIAMTGFVFKDPQYLKDNEFVPARLAMVCCAADLQPMGLLCKYEKAKELEHDSWVTVEGVLYKGEYQGQPEPQIQVSNISPASKVDDYLYPY